jgi:hypothetical protein
VGFFYDLIAEPCWKLFSFGPVGSTIPNERRVYAALRLRNDLGVNLIFRSDFRVPLFVRDFPGLTPSGKAWAGH